MPPLSKTNILTPKCNDITPKCHEIDLYTYIYIYIHVRMCAYVYACACMRMCMHVHVCVCVCFFPCFCPCLFAYSLVCWFVCTYVRACVRTYVCNLLKLMFMHTKMYTQDITRPSFCTQGLWAKPTEKIARVKTLQLSYNCTQLNSSTSNCSWAMILEQRSGLNPTQVQSQQAKQQKRCCHTRRVGNISIAILKSLPCNPVVQCPAVHPVEGRTPHCVLIATSSAQSPREWFQGH